MWTNDLLKPQKRSGLLLYSAHLKHTDSLKVMPNTRGRSAKQIWIDTPINGKFRSYSTNNENPKIVIRVQAEDQKSKATKPLERTYLYQGSDKQRGDPAMLSTNLRLHTPLSSCLFPFIFLSPLSPITPVSTSLVLELKACDSKCWDVLCVSSVSLLDRFNLV